MPSLSETWLASAASDGATDEAEPGATSGTRTYSVEFVRSGRTFT